MIFSKKLLNEKIDNNLIISNLGITNFFQLFCFLPIKYKLILEFENFNLYSPITNLNIEVYFNIKMKLINKYYYVSQFSKKKFIKLIFILNNNKITVNLFANFFIFPTLVEGNYYYVIFKDFVISKQQINYIINSVAIEQKKEIGYFVIYSNKLSKKNNETISNLVMQYASLSLEKQDINLNDILKLEHIHKPYDLKKTFLAKKYVENFNSILIYTLINYKKEEKKELDIDLNIDVINEIYNIKLTEQQIIASKEIFINLVNKQNCILIGEVGSGKTYVILTVIYNLVKKYNLKIALISPTILLNFQTSQFIEKINLKNVYCGTYGILNQQIFDVVIFDEEQKFGVSIKEKFSLTLRVTATPLPRTLNQIKYNELKGIFLLKNKENIKTVLLEYSYFNLLKIINENEKLLIVVHTVKFQNELIKLFDKVNFLILNGKLTKQEQEKNIILFKNTKKITCLATSVIEVGVDVKDLNTIVILQPQHFGFSQLHQIRGRAGRANQAGECILMLDTNISQKTLERLLLFQNNLNGFVLSEIDFNRKGSGTLIGKKQSGKYIICDINFVKKIYENCSLEQKQNLYNLANELLND